MPSNKRKVYIENPDYLYQNMFEGYGYDITYLPEKADLICFTGGADVHPFLYGRYVHPTTRSQRERDDFCVNLWTIGLDNNIPMVGICRGAQFVHVMNGYELVQDCDKHAIGRFHFATHTSLPGKNHVQVTSTHHQMMWCDEVSEDDLILLHTERSTYKQTMTKRGLKKGEENLPVGFDIESMAYRDTNSLSWQPHPEYIIDVDGVDQNEGNRSMFFWSISNNLEFKGDK